MGSGTSARVYWPALDGLRGLAVLLVFAYHARPSAVPRGGAIGVTMFFTLSGFLITTLLLREHDRSGTIDLRSFFRRRALRLLPAIVVLVAVTSAYSLVSDNLARTRAAAIPVLAYVFNWFRAFPGDAGGYGMLEHTWSLAVEEQFYVVWPLVVLAGVAVTSHRRAPLAVLVLAVGGSLASLVWRLQLWDADEPRRSAARLYNGTDAVADQLLIGAALAAGLVLWDRRRRGPDRSADDGSSPGQPWFDLVGRVVAPAALAYVVWVALVQPGGSSPANDRRYLEFGSATFALATAVVVVACTRAPDTWLVRLLARRGLVEVGIVSYGIYLWHYPVIVAVDDRVPDAPIALRGTLVVMVTAACALASWRWVERPFLARKRTPVTSLPAAGDRNGSTPTQPARAASSRRTAR